MVIVPHIVAAPRSGAGCFRSAKRAACLCAGPSFFSPFVFFLRVSRRRGGSVDSVFIAQKRQAFRKSWNAGLKVTPRVNPG